MAVQKSNSLHAKIVLALLGLIVVYGFFLRIYALGGSSLWIDEAISALAMENILLKGFPFFDSGVFYGRALVFHYLSALSLGLFGGDFGARIVSVFFGLGTIVLAFFVTKEFRFNGKENYIAGLVAALFAAVIFIEVAYSRQARFYQMFQFFFFLTLYFLYVSKDSKKYAWFSCISFLFLVDIHLAGLILAPLILNLFIREFKDWKLFVIPVALLLFYLPKIFTLALGSWSLVFRYVDVYSSSLFYYLGAFVLLSILGIIFAYQLNKRLTFLLVVPSAVLLFGVFFLRVFALRYVYFSVFLVPVFLGVIFSYIYRSGKILFVLVLLFSLFYPSNLFFDEISFTVLKPELISLHALSEPVVDYKGLSETSTAVISDLKSVVFFTPSFSWYFENPDYFIPFSLNGLEEGYALYEGRDYYTGAVQFDLTTPQITRFVLVEDSFGSSKLDDVERERLEHLKENCEILESNPSLRVYECNLPL